MPIIDIGSPGLNEPMDTAPSFSVTPGMDDVTRGSESPAKPAWGPTFGAAFRQDNIIGAASSSETLNTDFGAADPTYNPWEDIKGSKYEPRWSNFVEARNPAQAAAIRRQIDQEDADRALLASAPWYQSLLTQGSAGVLDLPTLMPGGAFVKGAQGGFAVAKSAAVTAAAAGTATAVQEIALQSIQETRPLSESAINVGASVFLGGLIGAAGAKLLSDVEWNAAVKALEADVAKLNDEVAPAPAGVAGAPAPASAGAAAVTAASTDANTIAGRAAGALASGTSRLNPALRLLESPSPATREVGTQLFENSLYLKKNMEGIASEPAVETLMKEWNSGLVGALRSTNDAFPEYRKAGGQLSSTEFREAVGRAMRRGDEDPDPFVAKVAKDWRSKVFDPLKKAAIETGQLPADVSVDTALTYFTRMWNRNMLIAREGEYKAIVQRWVEDSMPDWAKQYDLGVERRLTPLRREIDELEMNKLRRAEELRLRDEGGEIAAGEFSEADIRQALRIVEAGAPKPKGVQTLTQFVQKAGGLVDFSGELAHMGINNKSRPGFVRAQGRRLDGDGGGWSIDDMARHAWENGYFPEYQERPSVRDFLDALSDDFNKHRAVVREQDRDAYRLVDLVNRLEADLYRVGAQTGQANRFATSEEVKGMVRRVYDALNAEADVKIAALRSTLVERETAARLEREGRFIGEPGEAGRQIADETFNKLTGKTVEKGTRPEFITVEARGPLKERTFNIPDALIEQFLESDVEQVGRRYVRVMGADVELARKFGSPTMEEQLAKVREDYARLRAGFEDEKALTKLSKAEEADVRDLEALRDLLRGTREVSKIEENYASLIRSANHVNYIRSMGEVVLASLTDVVRPAMVHGLVAQMGGLSQLATNMKAVKLSVAEAQLAGNVAETVLGSRLATLSEIVDPYASRGPVEAFLENMTNIASKWNGIRIWTDWMKSMASVMTQNRILAGVEGFDKIKPRERAYLAYLGIDQSMAGRIAEQMAKHGEVNGGVRVANTDGWTDAVAVRTYRAAINKDVDSVIIQKSVADVPLFASTPTGRALLQFKSFALASHQKVLLRGLQEDQSRFVGGMIAMSAVGMFITYAKAVSGNRPEAQEKMLNNPGWWVGEGFDRSGVMSVPMEIANTFEKAAGFNPLKAPFRAFDSGNAISQKNQNRNELGSLLGPSAGMVGDAMTIGSVPKKMLEGEEVTKAQKNAAIRLLPFNSYAGIRQMLNYLVNPPQ